MNSRRWTNGLLLVIAVALCGRVFLSVLDRAAVAETFKLDGCVTGKPNENPLGYLHVVVHSVADVGSSQNVGR